LVAPFLLLDDSLCLFNADVKPPLPEKRAPPDPATHFASDAGEFDRIGLGSTSGAGVGLSEPWLTEG